MRKIPNALFIVDPRKERNAILEARNLHIPVFGIVDTNCDPDEVDYIIPANDDALRSVRLIVNKMADAVVEAKGGVVIPIKQEPKREKPENRRYNNDRNSNSRYNNNRTDNRYNNRNSAPRTEAKPVVVKVQAKPEPQKVVVPKVEVKPAVAPVVTPKVEAKPVVKVVKEVPVKEAPKAAAPVKKEVKASVDYKSMTVAELKAIAKEQKLAGYSKLRKAELIAELSK